MKLAIISSSEELKRGFFVADIGIDLGTATTIVHVEGRGIVASEPTAVAFDTRSNKIIAIGKKAYDMVGRAPSNHKIIFPLKDGVVSDFYVTEQLIRYFINKVARNYIIKPRVAVCIPSGSTTVESRAVLEAVGVSGVRKIFLIEEPVAAALGANIDISKPYGKMIMDIGGGTVDTAILTLNGIAAKASAKVAGRKMDESLMKYIRNKYNLTIGQKTAEQLKIFLANVHEPKNYLTAQVKGKDSITGYPKEITVSEVDTFLAIKENLDEIVVCLQSALEITSPELISDIFDTGVVMTGGGSLLKGLPEYLQSKLNVSFRLAEDPINAVALGTGKAFKFFEGEGKYLYF